MPKINQYIIMDIDNKKYYHNGDGCCCIAEINNATEYTKEEYLSFIRAENYILSNERFVKVEENGKLTEM